METNLEQHITGYVAQKGKATVDFTAVNDGGKGRTIVASLTAEEIKEKLANAAQLPSKVANLFQGGLTALSAVA